MSVTPNSATARISSRPHLALVVGLQGTGKSTVSESLAHALGWERITTETIRARLYPMTLDQKDADFSEEELRLTYAVVNLVVDHLLRRGVSVVVDGVYRSTRQRDAVLDIARAYDANVTAFCTRCPDDEVIRRLELRQASSTESPGGVRTYLATKSRFDDPAPNFVVLDTARSISEITRAAMAEIDMTRAAMAR